MCIALSRYMLEISGIIGRNCFKNKMSHLAKCHLVCESGSHAPIELAHKQAIIIGRSVQTRIADKKVSRQQMNLIADCVAESVKVTQLGGNPSEVCGKELLKGASVTMRAGDIVYVVAGAYPNTVQFSGGKQQLKEQKKNIGDFSTKKCADNGISSKRRKDSSPERAQGKSKRSRTEPEEEEEDTEHIKKVQERLARMKEAYHKVPAPVAEDLPVWKAAPEALGEPASAGKWDKHERLLMYTSAGVRASHKIAAFDIDGCIITTKSGKVFAQNTSDWKIQYPEITNKLKGLLSSGYKVVFFTNQMGILRGRVKEPDFREKIEGILSALNLPIQVFIASGPGLFRKPGLGMWNFLLNQRNNGIEVDINKSFYVGDAAGRPEKWAPGRKKDFAISDRLFALNAGLTFHTPEEYFLGYRPATFNMPDFDPRKLSKDADMFTTASTKLTLPEQEVIVNVGLPGSGKSHFVRTHLLPKGYVHVNRDTLGSWQKCVEATKRALGEGRSVVVDNTNVDQESRKRYLDVCRAKSVACRCFWFDVSLKHCRHNERFREMTDKSHQAINDMIFNQSKSKFKAPEKSEGFLDVVKVNFVPKFKDKTEEQLYRQFLMEK